jgi:hypothetical protein
VYSHVFSLLGYLKPYTNYKVKKPSVEAVTKRKLQRSDPDPQDFVTVF